jgi:hypothetical protein
MRDILSITPSCHHLQSEQVEVEGVWICQRWRVWIWLRSMTTRWTTDWGEEGMNMVGSNMVEVNSMYTVEKHFHPMNHRMEVEVIDMVENHFHPMNHRPEVEGMDTMDTDMGEDIAVELEVVERESEGVVLMRHWTDDGAVRHR